MALFLTVPTMGERQARIRNEQSGGPVSFRMRVMKATLVVNNHNAADELKVTCSWRDAGTDPRLLRNALARLYIGNANSAGEWDEENPPATDCRFIGLLTRAKRTAIHGEAMTVDLEFLDFTTLFIEAKPFGAKGIPHFSMRLDEAWRCVCSQTPGAEKLADGLTGIGLAERWPDGEWPLLKTAVSARFAKLGKVPTKPKCNAWEVWMQCVGMMGLISYIRQDECIVTTATHYFTSENPPRLIWGRNILRMSEARNPQATRGVGLASFDPLTATTIEAVWPPVGDIRIRKKIIVPHPRRSTGMLSANTHANAHRHKTTPASADPARIRQNEDRDWFQYASVHDPDALLECAKSVWEQRSRQEVEGTIVTAEMVVDRYDGSLTGRTMDADLYDDSGKLKDENKTFELMDLQAGDNVRIEIDQEDKSALLAQGDWNGALHYLIDRGYAASVAAIMASNMVDFALLDPIFYVKRVQTTLDLQGDGHFEVEVTYLNRILIGGDTSGPPNAEGSEA
jgi:hypothetical protein